MMTREQILEIDQYCQEHKMSYRQRLEELSIPSWTFYKAKRKYRMQDEAASVPGEFVQMVPGTFCSGMMPVRNARKTSPARGGSEPESFLTIELRTASGTTMRIQGSLSVAHLREIISAG